jgi:transglutaminase-like putative cysteine protease
MIYEIRHVTTYRYGSPVTFAQCTLTLAPRNGSGQIVERARLVIDPRPKVLTRHRSFFGHEVAAVLIDVPHSALRIEARAEVRVDRAEPGLLMPAIGWEAVRQNAAAWRSLGAESPVHFLFASPRIDLLDPVTRYARESFAPGRPAFEGGRDLMCRIRADFRYDPDATRVSTPLIEAFEKRHGVCQDYAHIMIAGLRGLGLPARYVSGYIRTIPAAGQPRLEGADATHAWVDLWCGPELGWVGLDPTNAILAGNDHVVLATGRDYDDVAPVGGILLGTRDQQITVNVDVLPIAAGERSSTLA